MHRPTRQRSRDSRRRPGYELVPTRPAGGEGADADDDDCEHGAEMHARSGGGRPKLGSAPITGTAVTSWPLGAVTPAGGAGADGVIGPRDGGDTGSFQDDSPRQHDGPVPLEAADLPAALAQRVQLVLRLVSTPRRAPCICQCCRARNVGLPTGQAAPSSCPSSLTRTQRHTRARC